MRQAGTHFPEGRPVGYYHCISRIIQRQLLSGDTESLIGSFGDDAKRERFLDTLDEVGDKNEWRTHALCGMEILPIG